MRACDVDAAAGELVGEPLKAALSAYAGAAAASWVLAAA
jgi:hypothetical protein